MWARGCRCPRRQVFADEPDRCHKCGHDVSRPKASTNRMVLALAEVMLGRRRIGKPVGGYDRLK